MVDDDSFWEAAARADTTSIDVALRGNMSVAEVVFLENGNVPCKHTCTNKAICRHLCCREGVPVSGRKRKLTSTSDAATAKSETLFTIPPPSASSSLNKPRKKMVILDKADIKRGRSSPSIGSNDGIDSPSTSSKLVPAKKVAPSLVDPSSTTSTAKQQSEVYSSLFSGRKPVASSSPNIADEDFLCKQDDFIDEADDEEYDFHANLPSVCIKIPDVGNHADSFLDDESIIPANTGTVLPSFHDLPECIAADSDLMEAPLPNKAPASHAFISPLQPDLVDVPDPAQANTTSVLAAGREEADATEDPIVVNDECSLMFTAMFQ